MDIENSPIVVIEHLGSWKEQIQALAVKNHID